MTFAALVAGALLLASASVRAQTFEAQLERNPIALDERVQLTLELDRRHQGPGPDLTALGPDFRIINSRIRRSVRYRDGQSQATTQWVILLAPQRGGLLSIPALPLGALWSNPLQLEVLEQPVGDPAELPAVFFEAEITPQSPYVGAQILYVLRLYLGLDAAQGEIDAPAAAGASVTTLGHAKTARVRRSGKSYRLIERRYAAFAVQAGELQFSAPVFHGELSKAPSDKGLSGLFGPGRRLRVEGDAHIARVRPLPEGVDNLNWRPAADLSIEESWSADPGALKPGVPVTRTLRVRALGLSAETLPELSLEGVAPVRSYADQPRLTSTAGHFGIIGERTETYALVPSAPGQFRLPAIRLSWWNTVTDQAEVTALPERLLTVLEMPASQAPTPAPSASPADAEAANSAAKQTQPVPPGTTTEADAWQWLTLAFGGLWLATLARLLYVHRQRQQEDATMLEPFKVRRRPSALRANALKAACDRGDAEAARDALLAIWREFRPGATSLSMTGLARDPSLKPTTAAAMLALDRALYGPEATPWAGTELWNAVQAELQAKPGLDAKQKTLLAPLNPA